MKELCEHLWHFMEKRFVGGDIRLRKTIAMFVCDKCGKTKEVEIENE